MAKKIWDLLTTNEGFVLLPGQSMSSSLTTRGEKKRTFQMENLAFDFVRTTLEVVIVLIFERYLDKEGGGATYHVLNWNSWKDLFPAKVAVTSLSRLGQRQTHFGPWATEAHPAHLIGPFKIEIKVRGRGVRFGPGTWPFATSIIPRRKKVSKWPH